MLNEKEIRNFMKNMENLLEVVGEPSILATLSDSQMRIRDYASATYETLSWVLGYIDTDDFKSEYLRLDELESILE
tara:strand:+ start:151 stop:378 length:228 start_codon:yes stop_codon:yes gene_type:complete